MPTIITTGANLVSINQYCLLKQFKDVYNSDTAVLHGIISKTIRVLRHIIKSWLKTLTFSNNESFPSAFQGPCSGF